MRYPAPTGSSIGQVQKDGSVILNPNWMEWFQRVSDYYDGVLKASDPGATLFGEIVPTNPGTGLLAYADGVKWNPGSGSGYYMWDGATWKFVGNLTPATAVVAATTFGLSAVLGVSMLYARADHHHGTPVNPVTAHVAATDPHTQYHNDSRGDARYQRLTGKDAASGYAGLNAASRITKGADTVDDLIVDLATKGVVLRDTADGHYFRITLTAGALVLTDLGATKP